MLTSFQQHQRYPTDELLITQPYCLRLLLLFPCIILLSAGVKLIIFILIRYGTFGSFLVTMIHLLSVEVWFGPEKRAQKQQCTEFHCIHIEGKGSVSLYWNQRSFLVKF